MIARVVVSVLFLFCLSVVSAPAADHVLEIPGTGDSQTLLRILDKEFEKSNPDIEVVIPESIGSGGGVKAVAYEKAELGRVARPLQKKEERYGLAYQVFAYSPVVFVANPSVTGVNNITPAQVVGIYNGTIDNWRQLGGRDQKIYVISREPGDSSRMILEKKVPGFSQISELAGKVIFKSPETVDAVIKHPDTICYAPLSSVLKEGLVILKYEGFDPITGKDYPLFNPMGLVWKGELSEPAARFKKYLFSKEAVAIIRDFGAIPVSN
ncbi:MAG: substrate-binding domain-containing protein [Proteobacteria bacterium]|nr:substrate-binding domain-containing protein [Pseudomonadota bacterium]MBU1715962.1 substrate-binding domain-containing protein [Pseudomonadota bacterium]